MSRSIFTALGVFCMSVACSSDDSTAPPQGVELAGQLRGTWQLATSTMPSSNPNVSCKLTGNVRLYERSTYSSTLPGLFPPAGVFGYFGAGAMDCAGVVDANPLGGEIQDFVFANGNVFFRLRPASTGTRISGTCSGSWSGDTMSGQCSVEYTSFGISQWQGSFTATRVSLSPEP